MIDRIRRAWDEGDAIFPLDQRLPAPARAMVMEAVMPTKVATLESETNIQGTFVESGDAVVVVALPADPKRLSSLLMPS